MTGAKYRFTVDGYEYRTYLDVEDDNMKIFHYCYKDAKQVAMPREFSNYTPYEYMTAAEFKQFLEML